MIEKKLISTQTICTQYSVEVSFVDSLNKMGLIQLEVVEQKQFIHVNDIGLLEKIIRLHHELNINLEGIVVVLNLLEKEKALRNELITLQNKLRVYEND